MGPGLFAFSNSLACTTAASIFEFGNLNLKPFEHGQEVGDVVGQIVDAVLLLRHDGPVEAGQLGSKLQNFFVSVIDAK